MKNKKGFTLVELLAVIVVLAILILIAVTAVLPQIEKSRKNSFYDEALIYKREAEKAFLAENIGEPETLTTCFQVNQADNTSTSSDYILNDNYVKKNGATAYHGKVEFNANGDVTTFVLTNGKYVIKSTTISKANVKKVGASDAPTLDANDKKC